MAIMKRIKSEKSLKKVYVSESWGPYMRWPLGRWKDKVKEHMYKTDSSKSDRLNLNSSTVAYSGFVHWGFTDSYIRHQLLPLFT